MDRLYSREEFIDRANDIAYAIDEHIFPDLNEGLCSQEIISPLFVARPAYQSALAVMNAGLFHARPRDSAVTFALDNLSVSAAMLSSSIDSAIAHIHERTKELTFVVQKPPFQSVSVITYQSGADTYGITGFFSEGTFDIQKSSAYRAPIDYTEQLFPERKEHTRVVIRGDAPAELALARGVLWYESKLKEK